MRDNFGLKLLPNLLSAARLALAPYIFHLLWTNQFRAAADFLVSGIHPGVALGIGRREGQGDCSITIEDEDRAQRG